jgi:hypothetical protein
MDADTAAPSGFYRSIVGDLGFAGARRHGRATGADRVDPGDFRGPGAAEVVAPGGVGLFGSLAKARDPKATAADELLRWRAAADHPRGRAGVRWDARVRRGPPARPFDGYVRATGLVPYSATVMVALTGAVCSPRTRTAPTMLVVAARLSELRLGDSYQERGRRRRAAADRLGDLARFVGTSRRIRRVRDGAYTWSLRGPRGQCRRLVERLVHRRRHRADSKATAHATAGLDGWRVTPVVVRSRPRTRDPAAGSIQPHRRRRDPHVRRAVTIATNGSVGFDYRAIDRPASREAWRHLTFRIDTKPPTIGVSLTGKAGDAASTWRGPVTLKPAFADATSGVAGRSVSLDGRPAKALTASTVVVERDGSHITFAATDAAGNRVPPPARSASTPSPDGDACSPRRPGSPPTVTPNGDGVTDTVSIPFAVSEAAVLYPHGHGPDGTRSAASKPAAVDKGVPGWDGRTAASGVPDGGTRSRSRAGRGRQRRQLAKVTVDVYAALAGLRPVTALFFQTATGSPAARRSASASWPARR